MTTSEYNPFYDNDSKMHNPLIESVYAETVINQSPLQQYEKPIEKRIVPKLPLRELIKFSTKISNKSSF